MAERAQVTSVEAIDSFRASLILYLSKARPVLDEVCHEVLRTQLWLQNDQRAHWERELRLRRKKLEQAQAELFSAMLSKIQKVTAAHQMAVHRAERDVKEVEAKQALLKQWDRELENRDDGRAHKKGHDVTGNFFYVTREQNYQQERERTERRLNEGERAEIAEENFQARQKFARDFLDFEPKEILDLCAGD